MNVAPVMQQEQQQEEEKAAGNGVVGTANVIQAGSLVACLL